VDDEPYGVVPGMVLKPNPVFARLFESIPAAAARRWLLMSPQGQPLRSRILRVGPAITAAVLLAGHYEGLREAQMSAAWLNEEVRIVDHSVSPRVSSADERDQWRCALLFLAPSVRCFPGRGKADTPCCWSTRTTPPQPAFRA